MMRERFVDIALLVALVLVAGVIIWTLFGTTLRRPEIRATTPAPVTQETESEAVSASVDVVAVDNAPVNADPATIRPVAPDQEPAVEESLEPVPVDPPEEAEAEPVAPLPEGAFSLERIGFSFVTGQAHACGIVLEAWQHVAVSPDILEKYPCGSQITIVFDEPVAGRERFTGIVADTMGPSNARTANVYVGQDEPAQQYGVQSGNLVP